jgi:hypothetical protein
VVLENDRLGRGTARNLHHFFLSRLNKYSSFGRKAWPNKTVIAQKKTANFVVKEPGIGTRPLQNEGRMFITAVKNMLPNLTGVDA